MRPLLLTGYIVRWQQTEFRDSWFPFIFLALVGAAAEEASSTSFTQQGNTLCGLNRYSTVDRTQGAIIFWLCSMPYDSWCNIILMEPVKNKIVWNREIQINNQKVENMFLYLEEDKLHSTNFGTLLTILISDQYHQRDTFGPLILLYQRHSNFCNNRNWNREKFHQYC